MVQEHGILNPQELQQTRSKLDSQLNLTTSTFATHLSLHLQIHNLLEENLQPISDSVKVEKLRVSIQDCQVFQGAIAAYSRGFPRVADQTFDNFSTAMKHEDESRDRMMTTGQHGYAAATTAKTFTQAEVDQLIQAAVARTQQQTTTATTNPNKKYYCWTHGSCKHDSASCKTPSTGHQAKATYRNQMGGKPA
jgi:hypothetical protein